MLYVDPTTTVNPTITGRNVAHAHRTAVERALLGAELHLGRLILIRPTLKQAAALVGVCTAYVAAAKAIADDPDARAAVLTGRVPLVVAGWSSVSDSLADHFLRSSRRERAALTETVGVDRVWDECIAPNI